MRWLAIAAAALLAGCAVPRGGEQAALPPAAAPYGAAQPAQAILATELAGPATYLPPLPTAVILLRPYDMERNRALCRAALQLPTVQQAEAASVVAPNLIRTRWPVQIDEHRRARRTVISSPAPMIMPAPRACLPPSGRTPAAWPGADRIC